LTLDRRRSIVAAHVVFCFLVWIWKKFKEH
jgi:hypothetical protein